MAPLASAAFGLVTTWLQGRQKISEQKATAKADRIANGIPGYSDEWLVFVWSAPIVMAFIPGLQEYATKGFNNLNSYPEWYVYGFMAITSAVFGIDKLLMAKNAKSST
jgi:hypothetical protein